MIKITTRGSFRNTERFLQTVSQKKFLARLDKYAQEGVNALASATPIDSGLTASSWGYEIEKKNGRYSIIWTNTHVVSGVPIAIILQYGHGTGTGGYVQGRDYINPALRPVFDNIAERVWKEVQSA